MGSRLSRQSNNEPNISRVYITANESELYRQSAVSNVTGTETGTMTNLSSIASMYDGFTFDELEKVYKGCKQQSFSIALTPFEITLGYVPIGLLPKTELDTNCLACNVLIIDKKYYTCLTSFQYSKDSLLYCFNGDIYLSIMKTINHGIIYNLKTFSPRLNFTRELSESFNQFNKLYISISNSKCCEFDVLLDFITNHRQSRYEVVKKRNVTILNNGQAQQNQRRAQVPTDATLWGTFPTESMTVKTVEATIVKPNFMANLTFNNDEELDYF